MKSQPAAIQSAAPPGRSRGSGRTTEPAWQVKNRLPIFREATADGAKSRRFVMRSQTRFTRPHRPIAAGAAFIDEGGLDAAGTYLP